MTSLFTKRLLNDVALLPRMSVVDVLLAPPTRLAVVQSAGAKTFKHFNSREMTPPKKFENVVMPERTRLPMVGRTPYIWQQGASMRPPRQTKELWRMRGEETVHTDLKLGQFGIVALTGGMLKFKQFEAVRLAVGRQLPPGGNSFAVWRVEAPYKPITSHGSGKRMGGGKGSISEYGTPIRAGRVILEVGGKTLWPEAQPWLEEITKKLPFRAMAVNAEMLKELDAEEQRLHETNLNPITFEYLVRNNMFDCQRKLSPYDKIWFGKFVYLDRQMNIKWKWVTKERYKGKK